MQKLLLYNRSSQEAVPMKLEQLQYEVDAWKRVLEFMMEENVHLKNRLSSILRDDFNPELLEEVEAFQTSFIKEDELVAGLRNEIADLDKLLVREVYEDGKIMKLVDNNMKRMRIHIRKAEERFSHLKLEFNSYLSDSV